MQYEVIDWITLIVYLFTGFCVLLTKEGVTAGFMIMLLGSLSVPVLRFLENISEFLTKITPLVDHYLDALPKG